MVSLEDPGATPDSFVDYILPRFPAGVVGSSSDNPGLIHSNLQVR
jgi:hypothetical protein